MGRTRFIFAGGGTGGHLYPGLAIAERLRARLGADASCLFVCSERPIDERILSAEHAEFRAIRARPVGLRPRTLARFLWTWGESVRHGREIIRQARAAFPRVVVVAMGGFVAAPVVMAAGAEGLPVTMMNLDAVPGKANRWITRRRAVRSGGRIFTTFPIAEHPDWTLIPPVVREAARVSLPKAECRRRLGLDPDALTLLVTGGSLGARTINQTIAAVFSDNAPPGWQVLHQCGKSDPGDLAGREALAALYASLGIRAVVAEFTGEMGVWWGAADLAVSRAGAGSVAEAWANRVPTLFMPYPFHADEHQRLNARILEQAGAAVIVRDMIDPVQNRADTAQFIRALLHDDDGRASMRAALDRLGPADGAERVAAALCES